MDAKSIPNIYLYIAISIHFHSYFFHNLFLLTGQGPISSDWAVVPGQRILKGLEEIKDAPTNDDIVVEADKAAHLDR